MKVMKYDKILRTKWTDSDPSGETVPQTVRQLALKERQLKINQSTAMTLHCKGLNRTPAEAYAYQMVARSSEAIKYFFQKYVNSLQSPDKHRPQTNRTERSPIPPEN